MRAARNIWRYCQQPSFKRTYKKYLVIAVLIFYKHILAHFYFLFDILEIKEVVSCSNDTDKKWENCQNQNQDSDSILGLLG